MDDADLAFAGLVRQAELVRAREVKPRELVELSLARIEQLDPQLNCVRVTMGDEALADADRALARVEAGESAPLLGVPVLVKDTVDVAGQVTTQGTGAYDTPAAADAEMVRRLRQAGAIVVGKTTTPEYAIWPFTETPTWGKTRNPWDLERTPGGSSGGSAAAVAAGLVAAATASDGGGSIRIPAACCGLFGLKPQRGRVSLAPHGEHWHGLSVNGGLTRSVADGALYLDVVAGNVDGDADRVDAPATPFAQAAATQPGKLRIAASRRTLIPGTPMKAEPRAAYEQTIELLRSVGHEVVEQDPAFGNDLLPAFTARYLRGIRDDVETAEHPDRLESRTRGMARGGRLISDKRLAKARAAEQKISARIGRLFEEFDVLLTPALAQLPIPVGRYESRGALWTFNSVGRFTPFTPPWNFTGQPAATVPALFTDGGLPVSVQIVGRRADEATLISLAAQLEAARPWADRRPPVS